MAKVLFITELVPHPIRENCWLPATESIRNQVTGNFPCSWVISTNPKIAVGIADVTSQQENVLSAEPKIISIRLTSRVITIDKLQTNVGDAIKTKLAIYGITVANTDSVESIFEKAIKLVCPETIDHLVNRFLNKYGY